MEDIHTYYGEAHILQGVSLTVGEGEVVTLIGRNGAGKTTTLLSIMGIARARRGAVRLARRRHHAAADPRDRPARHRAGCRRSAACCRT